MARFHLTVLAEQDLAAIAAYTLDRWGEIQAARYLDQLEACCQLLADSPTIGRPCDEIRPGLRRMEQGRHVLFFRVRSGDSIVVVRILHQDMLPRRRSFDDEPV